MSNGEVWQLSCTEYFFTSSSIWGLFSLILRSIEVLALIIRTEIDSREAYSCKRLVRIYFGSLKQTLIASFSIPCRRESCVFGAAKKAILPYSIIGLTYTLYSFMRVFASVPLFDRTRSTLSRFTARLLMESICFLNDRSPSTSIPRNLALGTGLIMSLNKWRARFSSCVSLLLEMKTRLDFSPFSFTLHFLHHPSSRFKDFWRLVIA